MKQRRSFLSILFCFVLVSFFGVASVLAQTCKQSRYYFTPNDTYDANRRLILSSLPSKTASQDGFYYGSIGQEPNRVYAAGMCVPRAEENDCFSCIKGALDKGDEKILVYEFVPNKSLDFFLFDPTNQGQLDWATRYKIIGGIGRGILYLHQDSPLKIIHRDLKVDNILLEDGMNPKIADFGMAKICGMDLNSENTSRIAGTEGYMAPEYMELGQFSIKSDVYSFGVLVLEIVCGKRNRSFLPSGLNLVTHAWRLWRDGSPLELLDATISGNYPEGEVTRCIHIALLCVQNDPADRPDMWTIMSWLTNDTISLPVPKTPGYFIPNTTPYQSTLRTNSHFINDRT